MADLPELKFDDDEKPADGLPELSFDDDAAASAPEAAPKLDVSQVKPYSLSDEIDMIAGIPGRAADTLANFREGVPGAGLAQKLGALVAPGDYDSNIERLKKERAERHARNPEGAPRAESLGASIVPAGGASWWSRILNNAGMAAADRATRADSLDEAKSEGIKGGLTAGAIQSLLESVGGAGKFAKSIAEDRAVKSLGPTLAQQQVLNNKGAARDLGREMLDEGVVKFGSSVEGMAPRLEELLAQKGQRIGDIRAAADDAGAQIDFSRLANKGDAKVAFSGATNDTTQAAAREYADNAANYATVPQRPISQTQQEIAELNNQIPFAKEFADLTPKQQAYKELRSDLVGQVDDQVRQRVPGAADEYQRLKEQFGLLKEGDKILDKSVARQQRNADIGLRDLLLGNAATKAGGGAKGVAAAVASKLARERGNAAVAATANRMSQMLGADPGGLGKFAKPLMDAAKRGNTALMTTHALLMQDPEYAQLVGAEDVK